MNKNPRNELKDRHMGNHAGESFRLLGTVEGKKFGVIITHWYVERIGRLSGYAAVMTNENEVVEYIGRLMIAEEAIRVAGFLRCSYSARKTTERHKLIYVIPVLR